MSEQNWAEKNYDLAVVGGGVVGIGTAWAAAKRGLKVLLLEKDPTPIGASIRNFGMVWPIGQPDGPMFELAMENRKLWLELSQLAGFQVQKCGSLHLAHHQDEWEVLSQYYDRHSRSESCSELRLLDPEETVQCSKCANPNGLLGAMWSGSECRVDPAKAISQSFWFLDKQPNVTVVRNTVATTAKNRNIQTACGQSIDVDQIVICSGAEFQYLRPEEHRQFGGRRCKLHMLSTEPPAPGFQLGPHLASGLTLRHYEAFEGLPALEDVKQRISHQQPELNELGIHVMMSQASDGSLVIGDSHQYDSDIPPRNSEVIDRLILDECEKVFQFPVGKILKRWSGVYLKHPDHWIQADLGDGVFVINGFGGCGMTLSLAVTEQVIKDHLAGKSIDRMQETVGC